MLLLCLSVVHPGPADFRVMPREPRKMVHITEGRRKYYIRWWLALNDPRLYCYTYEDLVCFKCSPQIFRLARWHSHCHSVPFKINHCHFCEHNRTLCNQNSLGSVQRQGTRLSPAFNYKTIFLKTVHVKSRIKWLHFEAAMPTADFEDSATQGSWESGPGSIWCCKHSTRRKAIPVHLNQGVTASSLACMLWPASLPTLRLLEKQSCSTITKQSH